MKEYRATYSIALTVLIEAEDIDDAEDKAMNLDTVKLIEGKVRPYASIDQYEPTLEEIEDLDD